MHGTSDDAITPEITRHRARVEKTLARLLEETDSDATLAEIQHVIFNEDGERPFIAYVMHLVELFGSGADRHIDALIPAIQDAWNYFPHKRLAGSCPAALMLKHVPGLRPSDLP